MEPTGTHTAPPTFERGTRVVVRNSLNSWSAGFQVWDSRDDGVRLRRVSDGAVLPRPFSPDELRHD